MRQFKCDVILNSKNFNISYEDYSAYFKRDGDKIFKVMTFRNIMVENFEDFIKSVSFNTDSNISINNKPLTIEKSLIVSSYDDNNDISSNKRFNEYDVSKEEIYNLEFYVRVS